MFDKVLLCTFSRDREATLRESFQRMVLSERAQAKGLSTKAKGSAKKGRRRSGDVVDLQSLLKLCAQAISACDQRGASDLLRQIRQHASPTGDGMQRLAYYLANGLEARLDGYGTEIYNNLNASWPVKDVIQHYHLFLAICPFRKVANFFSNKTIANLAEKSNNVHVVDFGSSYGLQWPSLIERLSNLPGGPPELRLTAINIPQPGFRPTERLEATGRRLASYAETFKVPFKYKAIASRWDEVKVEDIRIETGEVTIVNCINRLEELLDESVVEESPRDAFLNLIRKINPRLFIQGTVNSGYGSPFFISRFREALFYFAAVFDVLDSTIPRDNPERTLLEQETFGRKLMNAISCEGPERIDRPETYKRWHQRNMRVGFTPVPLDRGIMNKAKNEIARCYHKDFEVEEDGCWLLQGWKGRIMHALSTWKPATSTSS
ncbi:hypothetical protein MLD38_003657 [Melastoma candidum]|nr:hypothetical protein MLD38_003657 [Melastoma candidum]